MAVENWYRRTFGQDNPLAWSAMQQRFGQPPQPQPNWQPPSEYVPLINYRNAAQDVNNLLGSFFAQNYTPQPQPLSSQTYRTTPQGYTPYQTTPIRNDNPNAWTDFKDLAYKTLQDQAVQAGLFGLASGGLAYGVGAAARPAIPYALGVLGATRYGAPIVSKINQFTNSPFGKIAINAFEKASNLFW